MDVNSRNAPNRIPITVMAIEPMTRKRYKVKIKEVNANINNMNHQGEDYEVISNRGRGRYIMRKVGEGK